MTTSTCTGISVRTSAGEVVVPSERVYFSFGDGRLSYDCVACGAKCCRGFGYSVASGAEAAAHVQRRPALRLFLEPVHADGLRHTVTNCAPSCFFLTDQNLCGLQVEQGVEAKPETCRLFPFNNMRYVSGYLVVSPHSSLCPLTIAEPPARSDHSRHAMLTETMRFRGVGSLLVAWPSFDKAIGDYVALERAVVKTSEAYLDTSDFAAFVAAQIAVTVNSGLVEPTSGPYDGARAVQDVERHVAQMTSLLGLTPFPDNARNAQVVRAVVATTPSIRAHVLFGARTRSAGAGAVVRQLPFLTSALHLLAALAREAGMASVTYLTVMSLFQKYRALLDLLGSLASCIVLKRNAPAPWPLAASPTEERCYLGIIRGLVPVEVRNRALGDILLDNLPSGSADQRLFFLKRVAERLHGHIEVKASGGKRTWNGFRYSIQRATLARMSDTLAVTAALRASGRLRRREKDA